jgi:hypothetical protein
MRWAKHITRMARKISAFTVLVGKPERKRHLKDLDVDERIRTVR